MTRVEAVDKAIADYVLDHNPIDTAALAKIAIEANDAWLIENQRQRRGHVSADRLKLTLSDCDRAGR